MQKIKLYRWSLMLMILTSASLHAQIPGGADTRGPGIFGPQAPQPQTMPDGSVRHPDGTIQYPDGTIVHSDGTVRYPNGKTAGNQSQNRKPVYRNERQHPQNNGCNNACNMPPGQAKKKYGGNARDYAHAKKNCKKGRNGKFDDEDNDDRRGENRGRYPQQYPQTNPQQYPQQSPVPDSRQRTERKNPALLKQIFGL
jgi:hypothetical protein